MSRSTRPRQRAVQILPRRWHRAAIATVAAVVLLAFAAGCAREDAATGPAADPDATPAGAVRALAADLRAGDLAGYAEGAVPPDLHAELEAAWRVPSSRWPLSQVPLASRLQPMLAALAAEGSEARIRETFDRQFAGAGRELDAAAESLALFGVEYVEKEGDFSDAEREHYAQVIEAIGDWATEAPLDDPELAQASIRRLAAAARTSDLDEEADFTALGMAGSLERIAPFFEATKATLATYGLDLDASLDGLRAETVTEDGDRATVRVTYPLASETVTLEMAMRRIDGRWYPEDSMRNARASLDDGGPAPGTAPEDAAPSDAEAGEGVAAALR